MAVVWVSAPGNLAAKPAPMRMARVGTARRKGLPMIAVFMLMCAVPMSMAAGSTVTTTLKSPPRP
jgi:hypothetical protein